MLRTKRIAQVGLIAIVCLSVVAGVWFYTTQVLYGPYVKHIRRE